MVPTEIIVGVDGSAGSTQALRWAAQEAAYRGVDLVVLHVYDWRIYGAASPIGARFVADARSARRGGGPSGHRRGQGLCTHGSGAGRGAPRRRGTDAGERVPATER